MASISKNQNNCNHGMSLIELLIVLAVSSVIMMGMLTMVSNQQRETRALFEQMGALDVQRLLMQNLSNGTVCSYMLADSTYDPSNPRVFDQTLIGSSTPPIINFPGNQIIGSSAVALSGPSIVKVGEIASPLLPNLVVSDLKISGIVDLGGGSYQGDIEVGFDSTKLIRPIKPVKVRTMLTTDASTPRKIVSCSSAGNALTVSKKYCGGEGATVKLGVHSFCSFTMTGLGGTLTISSKGEWELSVNNSDKFVGPGACAMCFD